jgi:hypothetical protein
MLEIKIVNEINPITGNTKKIIELYLKSYNLVFIPRYSDLNEENINKIKIKHIYYSRSNDYKMFKTKVASIGYDSAKIDNLRLWKINNKYVLQTLKNYLLQCKSDKDLEFDKLVYLECNTK